MVRASEISSATGLQDAGASDVGASGEARASRKGLCWTAAVLWTRREEPLMEGGRESVRRSAGPCRWSAGGGFTLVEVMLAIVIVGTGIAAAMQLFVTSTQQNASAARMTVAANLANNVQELMAKASYADKDGDWTVFGLETRNGVTEPLSAANLSLDIDDFNGAAFNPPKDAGWVDLNDTLLGVGKGLGQYTQRVTVSRVSHTDFKTVVTSDEGVRKVDVSISFKLNATTGDQVMHKWTFYRFNDMTAKGPSEY